VVPSQDDEHDAREIIEFFVTLAEQDADLIGAFLKSAGFEPGTAFPRDALLKLTLVCRLAHWEAIGVADLVEDGLPSSREVFDDAIAQLSGEMPRFDMLKLCQRVHQFALRHLSWPQISGAGTFVLQDQSDPSEFLDLVAEFLYEFRDPRRSSEPHSEPPNGGVSSKNGAESFS